MVTISIEAFSAHPEDLVARIKNGETVMLTESEKPLAEIRPLAEQPPIQRQIGLSKGLVHVSDSFFDPLPDDELALWYGEAE